MKGEFLAELRGMWNGWMACDVPLADFLRHAWAAGEDDTKIIALVTAGRQTAA